MVTDAQVRLLRQKMIEGKTQEAASAAAGMSVRTGRAWQDGPLPSQTKRSRDWRTRIDPFSEVWERDVAPLLAADTRSVLDGKTLMAVLDDRYPGRFGAWQLRTLQRRMRDWRAEQGPVKEVFFEQVHPPGREAACDFTHATELGVTIAGRFIRASAVRADSQLQQVALRVPRVRRDLRGASCRTAGRALEARRCTARVSLG